ncbi:MAG: hypothetical protein BroJett042_11090 [Bacteroidota bacterium]|nr:MAG: hypothetical protein UZ12_BCD005002352 [Bacteroidetes bacterium OLB12]GIL22596.1 MAG: hypothetical protein BroJett042_11090 [Bacteroidota bacterium]HNU41325.1 hypothetical protein [Cyclobacteriaceae bacterium]
MMIPVRLKFLILFCCVSLKVVAQDPEVEFVLVKEDSPIYVHERWITFPGKVPAVKAREVKGEFLIRSSMYTILDLLKDESKIKIWQKHVSDFKVHLQPDTTWWLEYSYHDIPWPVSDQDHFLKYVLAEQIPGKQLFITFESVVNSKLAPVEKGVSRMELSGSWTLEQVNEDQVKVTYRILSMPSHIPRIFTDPVIRSNLMSTIKALTHLAEKM